jgi:hypothetical protein
MKRKKRAWNNTNPLFRYLQSKKNKTRKVKVKRKKSSGGFKMAKKRYHKKGSSVMSGGKLMNGFFKPKGLIANALIGMAAAELSDSVAPQVVPYQNLAVAGVVGGLPGVAGAFIYNNVIQKKGGGSNTYATGY